MPEERAPYLPGPALARRGWSSSFPEFRQASVVSILGSLEDFVRDVSRSQEEAWRDSIPRLQHEVAEVLEQDRYAAGYSAILEYELPLEHRRPDVVLLINGAVLVLELKRKDVPSLADIDQASGYARDLRGYHRECESRPVHPFLVLTEAEGELGELGGVRIVGPNVLDRAAEELTGQGVDDRIPVERFLAEDAYRPLPTLVEAARELFEHGDLRRVRRASAATAPAVEALTEIVHTAATTKTRHLVLLTGVPGSGKTLVGLQIVHARFLDDLAVPRVGGKPTAPAVYLSGNGPLVRVLQYELGGRQGNGKTFVRDVKPYVQRYSQHPELVPPEHVLIFDEAQRAFSADKVAVEHPDLASPLSEPEHFVEFAERIPEWCVLVGLIGSGQEIHEGEEAGLGQWRKAVERSTLAWQVHGSPDIGALFGNMPNFQPEPRLHLAAGVRFHLASSLHEFVESLLAGDAPPETLQAAAETLERQGYGLRITRSLEDAKGYLRERYAEDADARFGLIASSRDKDLAAFGVPNGWESTQQVRVGPWFGDGEDSAHSCRRLEACVTEFGCQGLELDAALLAWGSDLVRDGSIWSNAHARRYARGSLVRDPLRLRLNAYRVLLTRGRDVNVVFVPPPASMDETYRYLAAAGFRPLVMDGGGKRSLYVASPPSGRAAVRPRAIIEAHGDELRREAFDSLPTIIRAANPQIELRAGPDYVARVVVISTAGSPEALELVRLPIEELERRFGTG